MMMSHLRLLLLLIRILLRLLSLQLMSLCKPLLNFVCDRNRQSCTHGFTIVGTILLIINQARKLKFSSEFAQETGSTRRRTFLTIRLVVVVVIDVIDVIFHFILIVRSW